jgi:hypothetical protein
MSSENETAAPLKACLAVLYAATLEARAMGWHGTKHGLSNEEAERLAKLMDAVHNVPALLSNGQVVDASRLRASLKKYDDDYSYVSHAKLLVVYDRAATR